MAAQSGDSVDHAQGGRWRRWGLRGALLSVLVGLGYYWWDKRSRESRGAQSTASKQRAEGESAAVRVKTIRPRHGGITRTTTQPGVVHAFEYADLYAKSSGFLRAQVVDIGDTVTRGQVLAEVYDPERRQRVEEAAAEVERRKADVTQAEAAVEVAKSEIVVASALLKERKAEVTQYVALRKYRQKEYVRYVELAVSRAIDERAADEKEQNFESARSGEEVALAAVQTAEGRVQKAGAELEHAKADLKVALANVRVAEAAEATARILADYIQVVSPYDGVVTRRTFHRGDFVRSASEGGNDKPVLSVARTDLLRVVVYVPDRDVPFVDRGDAAVIRLDALPGESFRAKVARYANIEDPANRTMRVEVDLPNPTGRLRMGMYGAVTILLEPPANVLTIPAQALNEKSAAGEGSVFLARQGRARKVRVQVGKDNGMRAEILSGVSEHDDVVLSYVGALDDGDPVDPEATDTVERGSAHE